MRSNLDPEQPVIGLFGSNKPIPLSREFLATQLESPVGRAIAERSPFFRSPENAALLFVGDLQSADPNFVDCEIATDDKPLMAFLGPRSPIRPLVGISFLDWMGKRFLRPIYPSCDIDQADSQNLLASIRAGNFYFATAVYQSVIKGDSRSDETRLRQVSNSLEKAHALSPRACLPQEALGQ